MATKGTKNQGLTVWIGTTAADPSGDTFTQVKRCNMLGEFGPDAAVLDATAYEDDAKEKIKGMVDNGDTEVGGRRVFTDAGQNALKAAASASGSTPYNFRVEIPNAGAAGATLRYSFKAIASKFRDKPGGVDNLIEFTASLAISGAITESTLP